MLLEGQDQAAFEFLNMTVKEMPKPDAEYVMSLINAFTSAMAYEG